MVLYQTPHYVIRHLNTMDELLEVEHMQMVVWGISNHIEVVPKDILLIVQKNGGLVLGAFDPNGKMLGFLFGFIGQTQKGTFKHCSHMMGVLPEVRHHGIGEKLKFVQRQEVLKQGLSLITWTVNPLEGVNASLNFGKLGVICRTLLPNFYGEMEDELNKGLPSDRFEVEWWLDSERVIKKIAEPAQARTIAYYAEQNGAVQVNAILSPSSPIFPLEVIDAPVLILEVPANFQDVKSQSLELAKLWIDQTRVFFQEAFRKGFVVTDFFSDNTGAGRRNYYVLENNIELPE